MATADDSAVLTMDIKIIEPSVQRQIPFSGTKPTTISMKFHHSTQRTLKIHYFHHRVVLRLAPHR